VVVCVGRALLPVRFCSCRDSRLRLSGGAKLRQVLVRDGDFRHAVNEKPSSPASERLNAALKRRSSTRGS
jgi:hypothetical protein